MTDLESLASRLDALEEEVSEERQAREELEGELADVKDELKTEREARREAEARVDELEDELESVQETNAEQARDAAVTKQRLTDVEDALEASDAVAGDGTADGLALEELTPLEQFVQLPEPVAEEQLNTESHRNTYRARNVVKDWFDYASKAPVGYVVWNRDLTRILTALEEGAGKIDSKTGERVMRRAEEASNGAFVHEKRDGQHVLRLDDPDALPSMNVADEVVS